MPPPARLPVMHPSPALSPFFRLIFFFCLNPESFTTLQRAHATSKHFGTCLPNKTKRPNNFRKRRPFQLRQMSFFLASLILNSNPPITFADRQRNQILKRQLPNLLLVSFSTKFADFQVDNGVWELCPEYNRHILLLRLSYRLASDSPRVAARTFVRKNLS